MNHDVTTIPIRSLCGHLRHARRPSWLLSALAPLALLGCATAVPHDAATPRPPATGAALAPRAMVAAANPLAVEAGLRVLREGGSAVDAAVAVQAVLGLVEPQSSGLGGGAFLVYFDAASRRTIAYDGRETAPSGATPRLFLDEDGKPLPFVTAVLSGRSTGVPGAIAMLATAQRDHGRRPWASLFADAARLADEGFIISPRLAGFIAGDAPEAASDDAVHYFTRADGQRFRAGDRLRNPAYASTVRRIAAEGAAGLLEGPVAAEIVDRVGRSPLPGSLTQADLKAYRPHVGPALCRPYRVYVVCVPDAPSGGPSLLEALGLLARTDIAARGPDDGTAWFLFAQASRLAYADRDRYIGDPAFVPVPVTGLLDPDYLDTRARLIGDRAGPAPAPGRPKGAALPGIDATSEPGGTSHVVIVDAAGNVVSMTTTVESIFGSGRMAAGFFLNNQLTDFSFAPVQADGTPAANAVAAGKRPRSTMAPAIVLDRDGRFVAALGSPGGTSILAYNLKTLVAVLDWRLPMQAAAALPNLIARGDRYTGDGDRLSPEVTAELARRGIVIAPNSSEASGIHGIVRRPRGYEGGADPRREGVARGY